MLLGVALAATGATGAGAAAAQEPGLPRLDPLATVGCVACDGKEAFGAVQGLALLSDGTLVVLDRDQPMVRLFDRTGRAVTSWGRSGDGPGELRLPTSVAATAADEVVVGDVMKTGLLRYRPDGTFVDSHPVEQTAMDVRASPDGRWITVQEARWATMSAAVHLLDADLKPMGTPLEDTQATIQDGDGQPAAPAMFSSVPAPDGRVAVGLGVEYRIRVFGSDGELVQDIRRDIPRTRRTPAQIEAIRQGRAAARRLRGAPSNPEGGADEAPVDPFHPYFGRFALAYDQKGRLWVRTPRGGDDATVFDLFGSEGGYLGEVTVPVPVQEFVLRGGVLAAVSEDPATGVQSIRRWALR